MYPLPRRQNHRLGSRSHDALARDLSLDHPLIRDHRVARALLCEVSNLSRTASREPPRTTGVTPGARVPRPTALFAKAGVFVLSVRCLSSVLAIETDPLSKVFFANE